MTNRQKTQIGAFIIIGLGIAALIGQTPDKGPYTELQETINKIQADPMINEFGGVDGTTVPIAKTETVANTLEY